MAGIAMDVTALVILPLTMVVKVVLMVQ